MIVRLLALGELTPAERHAWLALAADAAEPNPFYEPQMLEPAWRHLGPRRVALLVAEDEAGWLACLPVRRLGGSAALVAWSHPYCFLTTPLIRRGEEACAVEGLLSPLRGRRSGLLSLPMLGCGEVERTLRAAATAAGLVAAWDCRTERGAFRLRDAGEDVAFLPSKRRSELRRSGRRLAEELGAPLTTAEHAADPAAYERFLALEASGWKGAGRTALASDPARRRFFLELAAALAADGRLQLRVLAAGEQVVAMSCEVIAGDTLFGFKSAYDERYRARAPGVQLLHDTLTTFQSARRGALYDSCSASDNALANQMFPDRRELTELVLATRAVRPLAHSAMRGAIAARARLGALQASRRARRTTSATG